VLAGVREAARNHPRVIGGGGDDRPVGGPALWVGDIDELWKLPKPTGRGGPWHDSAVEAGQASDPYLMAGYDKKRLELSHDQAQPLAVTIEIDPAGDGQWLPYAVLAVPPGDKLEHAFPAGFSAHWIRFMAAATCRATATLVYE
jgi:hypothetical protein